MYLCLSSRGGFLVAHWASRCRSEGAVVAAKARHPILDVPILDVSYMDVVAAKAQRPILDVPVLDVSYFGRVLLDVVAATAQRSP